MENVLQYRELDQQMDVNKHRHKHQQQRPVNVHQHPPGEEQEATRHQQRASQRLV